jgi:UV DNA damage endonuclease
MKIGYPCINWTIGCKGDRTFRLKSYSERRLIDTARNNLDCLLQMLRFNVDHDMLFFRITSDLIPLASHPVCRFDWLAYFQDRLAEIGAYIMAHDIRISMHPGQFAVLNSPVDDVFENTIEDLRYHVNVLAAMGLDSMAKIQLHVGGVYGNKEESVWRFIRRYGSLDAAIKRRLVIENDDRAYTVSDCLRIYAETGVPILGDVLHHELNSSGESTAQAISSLSKTWGEEDGILMVDYSSQEPGGSRGSHTDSIALAPFERFLRETQPTDFDIMLEIKDKERSALKAVQVARNDERFFRGQDRPQANSLASPAKRIDIRRVD